MIKHFCDRCGKEVTGRNWPVQVEVDSRHFEFCDDCAKQLMKFLNLPDTTEAVQVER